MKPTVGELFLTILVIAGLGAIGIGLYVFAPEMVSNVQNYVTEFFTGRGEAPTIGG